MISRACSTAILVHSTHSREVGRPLAFGSNPPMPTVSRADSSLRERRFPRTGGSSVSPASTTREGSASDSRTTGRQGWIPAPRAVSRRGSSVGRAPAVGEQVALGTRVDARLHHMSEGGASITSPCTAYAPLAQAERAPGPWAEGIRISSPFASQPGGRSPSWERGNTRGSNPAGGTDLMEPQVCSSGLITVKWPRGVVGSASETMLQTPRGRSYGQTRLSWRSIIIFHTAP